MTPARLLARLAAFRSAYGPGCAETRLPLLRMLEAAQFRTAAQVEALHELLCFLHAYPDNADVFAQVARMLGSFHARPDVQRHRPRLLNSGIAGTDIVYPFGFSTARWLAARCGGNLSVEWSRVDHPDALEGRLQLFSLWAERPVFDEPPIERRT